MALPRDVPTPGFGQHGDDGAVWKGMRMGLSGSQWFVLLSRASFLIFLMLLGSVIQAAAASLGQLEGIAPKRHMHPWQKEKLIQC